MNYNYLIVGSGLYGATIAQQAKKAGKSVLVIDKRPNVGGNIYTEKVEGINVHKYGAHIFHTNNKEVWDYVTSFVDFNRFTNSPVANYKGELYSMPFNMYTFNKMWGVVTPEEAAAKIEEQKKEITGEPKNLEEGADYTITSVGGNGSWSQYTYKIDKSVFQGDGSYLVTVYSEDNAGNINENINESKQAEIGFGVDGTAPVIVPINIEEGQSYNTQNYEATVSVIDNLVLQDIKVILNGQTLSYTQDGDDISFSIPESDKRQTVAISAKDAAGNEVDCEIADLLVSTNSLIRLLNNTPAVIAIVCGVAVVGVGTGVFAGLRRKRTVHIKRKK